MDLPNLPIYPSHSYNCAIQHNYICIILWSYAMASTMKRLVQSILGHVQVVTPMTRTLH